MIHEVKTFKAYFTVYCTVLSSPEYIACWRPHQLSPKPNNWNLCKQWWISTLISYHNKNSKLQLVHNIHISYLITIKSDSLKSTKSIVLIYYFKPLLEHVVLKLERYFTQIFESGKGEASESTQFYATRVFFLSLFSCNYDDQLSPNFHRACLLFYKCMLGYTWWWGFRVPFHGSAYRQILCLLYRSRITCVKNPGHYWYLTKTSLLTLWISTYA